MSVIIRAHFDGNTIVPDSKVDLPAGEALEVELRPVAKRVGRPRERKRARAASVDVTTMPFFGMWADRKDMADSAKWVRRERGKWSSRLSDPD